MLEVSEMDDPFEAIERLKAEAERLKAEKQSLVWRLEELMDRWGSRRNELIRGPGGLGSCTETRILAGCVEELGEAIPGPGAADAEADDALRRALADPDSQVSKLKQYLEARGGRKRP